MDGMSKNEFPVLISFFHLCPNCVTFDCMNCGRTVYEQQKNLDRVREMDGFVICVGCALLLKAQLPEEFPVLKGQLWQGELQKAKPAPGAESILEFFNKKGKIH
jgi:hypothetical protein